MILAVVGTGTDVGKTIVSAVVLTRYQGVLPLAYWKPVASGADGGRDSELVARLAGPRALIFPETYLFPAPLSPHLAARLAGSAIDPQALLADLERYLGAGRSLLIEGAGGLLVPLAGGYLQADLLLDFQRRAPLACLVVATPALGTINHTLLTLEALRARGLPVAAVVLSGPPNEENRQAILRYGLPPHAFELPPLAGLDRPAVSAAASAFDPAAALAAFLRPPAPLPAAAPHRRSSAGGGGDGAVASAGEAAVREAE
ncbi:MAG TPA: dethiobiotin synthase [Thermoanaerobaculia bacterium]|nr:dethiobiotin synthase [Thermoanaerobaculia bacterium]